MSGAKILVVEDERITAEDIKAGLEFDGYQVPVICSSGEDAVQKAGKIKPDLVLMDIHLADGASFEIFEHVQVNCPVIFAPACLPT